MFSCFRAGNNSLFVSVFSKRVCKTTMPKLLMSKTGKVKPRHMGMMAFENNLPKLPVPHLQQTMDKYIKAVEALVDNNEFENTKRLVEEFRKPGGIGILLQNKLLERAKVKDNWLIDWWNSGYTSARVPLPICYSPATTFQKEYFKDSSSYLKYTAKLIANVLKFKQQIDNETLSVDMMGKDPLNMVQYKLLLGGERIPKVDKDEFVMSPIEKSKHVLVGHRNQFFVFDVYHSDGKPLSEGDLLSQLMKVVESKGREEEPVGILTSTDRTFWANNRKQLYKDKTNKQSLDLISSALFVVCLDKPPVPSTQAPSVMEDTTNSVTARQNLHGDGANSNSMNRWFDKTINFCISEDGHCGSVYEHTPAEAPTVARLWEFTSLNREGYESITASPPSSSLAHPMKLKWNLNSTCVQAIEKAKCQMESAVSDVDVKCFKFEHYGKNFMKSKKLSPDAWIQLSLQLTHYRLHGHVGPAYETGSTRKFLHGRTETIRSGSVPTLQFVQAMASSSFSSAERLELMRKAILAHTAYTKAAIQGQGIDRHLLGLKNIAVESGMNLPELFMDSTYAYSMHFKISTSQVPMKTESYLIFGPAVPDGYGICYNPHPDKILFSVTTYNSNPSTNPGHFAAYLQKSLDDMCLLTTSSKL